MIAAKLPEGWADRRLRFDARLNPVKSEISLHDDDEVSFVPMDAVGELGGLRLDEIRTVDDVYTGYTYFCDDDVVVAKITPCFENGKGAYATGLHNGVAFGTTELHVIRANPNLDARFLFYVTMADDFRSYGSAEMLGAGGQKRVPERFVKDWQTPLPAIDIQRRIAGFLDEKLAQIDGLIARKQALLERLAEKRQAIITQAVTKGLNPAAPMKDSGIEWFGNIPAHWQMRRLNSFCDFQSGKAHEPFIDPEGAFVCVNARFISTNGEAEKRCTENLSPATPGDILMVMSDLPNGRALARTFLADDRDAYAVNQRVCRIRPHRGDPRYFSYQLNRNPQLMRHDDGNEQTHLPNAAFKQLLLLEPPADEQQQIVTYLGDTLDKLDGLKRRVDASVNRLAEYRSALITSAVTGQIEGLP